MLPLPLLLLLRLVTWLLVVMDITARLTRVVLLLLCTADRTVASGEGGLEYIATAAGLQQFKQVALAYVLLAAADAPVEEEEVARAIEALLQQKLQLQVGLACEIGWGTCL